MRLAACDCLQTNSSRHLHTFWESHALLRRARCEAGSTVPRKIDLNWFMPALAKSRVGSWWGTTLLLGTSVCCLLLKKSRNVCRTRSAAEALVSMLHSRRTLLTIAGSMILLHDAANACSLQTPNDERQQGNPLGQAVFSLQKLSSFCLSCSMGVPSNAGNAMPLHGTAHACSLQNAQVRTLQDLSPGQAVFSAEQCISMA